MQKQITTTHTSKQLNKSTFSRYAGCIKEEYKERNSVELAKNWTKYID